MPLSPYFLQGSDSEQRLVQDLINEQLKIYGQDIVYLPRKIVNKSTVFKEITASRFDDSFRMEAYLLNYDGFEGSGDILTKFGVQTTDAVTFVISKERYEDFVTPFLVDDAEVQLATRPEEGDLIYFPLDNTIFEIKYVEAKKPFYQLNKLFVYTLSCEVMDYELDEQIETSIDAVNEAVVEFGYTVQLAMVGLGAATATASIQKAESVSENPYGSTSRSIGKIDLIHDGTGYTAPPTIGITTAPSVGALRGTDATAVAIMTSRTGQTGQSIDRILVINPGFGYTEAPTVTITPVNQFGAGGIATAVLQEDALSLITVTDGGSEYGTVVPDVTVSSPSVGAAATASINGGVVNALTITNGGTYYTSAPLVVISDPPSGTTATATATIATLAGIGTVNALTITNPGSGYTMAPTVSIGNTAGVKAGTGFGTAIAEAFLNVNGEVTTIRYSDAGYGYVDGQQPTITVEAPVLAGLSTGDYLYRENVRGVGSGTTASVISWDADTRILQVNNVSGNFILGETVVGIGTTLNGSDTAYSIKSISDNDDTEPYSVNSIFESEGDSILDFSERNPFGEF